MDVDLSKYVIYCLNHKDETTILWPAATPLLNEPHIQYILTPKDLDDTFGYHIAQGAQEKIDVSTLLDHLAHVDFSDPDPCDLTILDQLFSI